ncbi:glycosyl hydrolases family 18-domain-containing protein [Halteromyces radiatus]|uniref:glycosyl hydrolases family 18-domain-containing protein n=1 Tax=Halteromyces radiatus TaxID=101107 RepID=UPI002220948A|nr:glycosyl hydrolases family 18-domain-containing protein [Halteromyces radiatus]KAI8080054.1 glycosyl hydrolases family 18-domain-containing protein [Halteromyces radiatus]
MKFALLGSLLFSASSALAAQSLVGYFPNWLYAKYPVSQIDFSKYTHINYAFAILISGATPTYTDPQQVETQLPQLVSAAHAKNAKVLLSVGGWSGCLTYSTVAADASQRQTFINWNIGEIKKYNLDGIDLDWEYPGSQGAGCNVVDLQNDAKNYLTLLQELRAALDSSFPAGSKEISIACHVRTFKVPGGYMTDVSDYVKVIDRFNLMTYDINGAWNSTSGPNAPFNFEPGLGDADSFVSSINNWMSAGVPASKIIPGVAFYGRSATATVDMSKTNQYQPQNAGNPPSGDSNDAYWQDPYCSKDPGGVSGVWRYANLRSQGVLTTPTTAASPWIRNWDNITQTPWLFNPTTKDFISYDDPTSVGIKTDYALSKNLGGLMVWSVDEDNGELLNVVAKILTGSSGGGNGGTVTSATSATTSVKPTSSATSVKPTSSAPTSSPTSSGGCGSIKAWDSATVYVAGDQVTYNGKIWKAAWWTQGDTPGGSTGVWTSTGSC